MSTPVTISNFTGPFSPANWQVGIGTFNSNNAGPTPGFINWAYDRSSVSIANFTQQSPQGQFGGNEICTTIMGTPGDSSVFTITFTAAYSHQPTQQPGSIYYRVNNVYTNLTNGANTVQVSPGDVFGIGMQLADFDQNTYTITVTGFSCSGFVYPNSSQLIASPVNNMTLLASNWGANWNPPSSTLDILFTIWKTYSQIQGGSGGFYGGHFITNTQNFNGLPSIYVLQPNLTEGDPQPLALPLSFPTPAGTNYLSPYFLLCLPQAPTDYVSLGNVNIGSYNTASWSEIPYDANAAYLYNYRCVHKSYVTQIQPNQLVLLNSVTNFGDGSNYLNVFQLPTSGYFLFTIGAQGAYPTGQIWDLDPAKISIAG